MTRVLITSLFFFALAISFPLFLLAWAPIVLGAPHILANIRFLVLRAGILSSKKWLWIGAAGALGIGLQFSTPVMAALIFLHNLIALFIWCLWTPPRFNSRWLVVMFVLLLCALLLSGLLDPLMLRMEIFTGTLQEKSLLDAALALVPTNNPQMAIRWLSIFVFLQMVHYAVWLHWIPRMGNGISLSSWLKDCGPLLFWGSAGTTLLLIALSFENVWKMRSLYLQIGSFHVWLELMALPLICLKPPAQKENPCLAPGFTHSS